ncbi:MAG: plastocyanin/azurin family copper-binding protein [Oligoflexia bacterium]|nr:plastocyanin/azurin family copper-binding protein [Oligoflexia bacterium]
MQPERKVNLAYRYSIASCLLSLSVTLPVAWAHTTRPPHLLSVSTKGTEMSFEPTEMTVRAGQHLSLTFKNASDPAVGFSHNWVLVKPGTKANVVAAGPQAGQEKDYVPDSPDVIAHTHLLKPGESQTIQFTAPPKPGDYPYFCNFPGHSELLKGMLHVTG